MSSRVRRTLIDNAQLIRRSPRLSSKEPESRNLTPPRPSRTKLTVPQSGKISRNWDKNWLILIKQALNLFLPLVDSNN